MEILDKLNLASTEVKIKGKGSVVLPEVVEDNVNYVVGVDSEGKANVDKISFLKDLKSTDPTLSGNSEFYKSVNIDKEEGNLSVVNKYYNELTGLRTENIVYIDNDKIVVSTQDNESGNSVTQILPSGVASTGTGIFSCSILSKNIIVGSDLDDAGGPTGNLIILNPDGFSVGNVDNNKGACFIFDRSKTTTSSSIYTIATTEDIPDSYTKVESDNKYISLGKTYWDDIKCNSTYVSPGLICTNNNGCGVTTIRGGEITSGSIQVCSLTVSDSMTFPGDNVSINCNGVRFSGSTTFECHSTFRCGFDVCCGSVVFQDASPVEFYVNNGCSLSGVFISGISGTKADGCVKISVNEGEDNYSIINFSGASQSSPGVYNVVSLPISSSGEIALTSDIPDSYTKTESDKKYLSLGRNYTGNDFININIDDSYASIAVGDDDQYTLIDGCGVTTEKVEAKSAFIKERLEVCGQSSFMSDVYFETLPTVSISYSESCLGCLENFTSNSLLTKEIILSNFVPATYKHGTYNKETYEVDELVTFKNDVYVGSYAWIKTDACNPIYMGGLNFATRSAPGENSYVIIANIGGDGGTDYSWFKSPPHIGDSDVVAVVSQIPDISGKADRCSTLAGYGITDAYTKTEVDKKIPTDYLPVIALDANGDLVSDTGNSPAYYQLYEGFCTRGPLKAFSNTDFIGPVTFEIYPESKCSFTFTKETQFVTKKYVDDSICASTQHLKTKSYQSVETTGDKWTITLDSEYSSAPFFQVFNSENSAVYPEVKFTAPSTLELTFEGKEGIGLGEFTAVVSVPFTTTITPDESYVSIGTAQGISGKKNFTTVPTINSVDVATVDNLSTVENSVRSYVDTEISAKIASVYRFKGDSAYASLPANAQVGDVYNLTTASGEYKIGDNVAWTGSKWDKLAATVDLSGYLTTSSASSTYLTKSSASSTYATKDDTLSTSDIGIQYMAGSLYLNGSAACFSAPYFLVGKGIYVGLDSSDTSYFNGPVEFTNTVSVSELEIDNLSLETLEIANEINVNGIAVSESISKLNAKTGSLEYVLPAKAPSNGVVEWEVTINTDLTKTVKCPPNVIVCDITGERYKYVVCDVEWDGANKIYIKFDNDDPIEDNQFKAYITNIQLQ